MRLKTRNHNRRIHEAENPEPLTGELKEAENPEPQPENK